MQNYTTIDEYIANFPESVQKILEKVRSTIKKVAPEAEETIGYGIPTFKLHGNLVHFAGYAHHIGFYPGPEALEVFAKDLKEFELSKGTVRLPLDKEIPYDLIEKITRYRVEKNTSKKKA